MNEKAVIDNRDYYLSETLPLLAGQDRFVLCEDNDDNKFLCPEDFWLCYALEPESIAPVYAGSTSQEKIDFFLSLFRGREDVYAKRYHNLKFGKSGYVPVCRNEWELGLCDKKAYRCPECPNRASKPLTSQTIRAHLMGKDQFCRDVVGIYPMLESDCTWLLAVDFDEEMWREDATAFREACLSFGIVPAVERSRSGNGASIWFFFSEPISAADARRLGSGLLPQAMARRHELRFKSYDRLFPAQDTLPKGGIGSAPGTEGTKTMAGKAEAEGTGPQGFPKTDSFDDLQSSVRRQDRIFPEGVEHSKASGGIPKSGVPQKAGHAPACL